MKKVPSIRMPDPKAGVIRSEHPRAVGPNGLVEAANWILRDGSMQVRDGIKPVTTPPKTLIAPGTSWADETNDVWSATLTTEPTQVWMDGTHGTLVANQGAIAAEFDWWWDSNVLYVWGDSDVDTLYTAPGVEHAADGESVIGLASYDYQGQDDSGNQSVIRDQLIAVTSNGVECYDNSLGTRTTAVEANLDWAWDGAYGWSEIAGEWKEYGKSPKISIDWSNINWTVFGANTLGLGIRVRVVLAWPARIELQVYEIEAAASPALACRWILAGTDSDDLPYSEYEPGVPYQIETPGNATTGIYFIFNDTWDSWNDELAASGQTFLGGSLEYNWAVYEAAEYGLPDGEDIVTLSSTDRPVIRTWDYEQTTHNLIATEGSWILDVDSDSLATTPSPTITVSGDTGVAPRAKTIGIAAQRIVAGNVSYFDTDATVAEAWEQNYLDNATNAWHSIVPQFAYFPDAVVYSGTVLTGGHLYWYPADILRLADTPGEVVASQEMGTQMIAIYKTDAIYTLTAQSGISPFAPSLRASGIQGPVSPRSVVAISDSTHLYLARDGGIYLFSGATPQSLGDQFRTWVAREIDPEYAENSFMIFDPERNEVHAYYAVKGSGGVVRKGIVVDVSKQPFTAWPVLWPKQVYNEAEDTLEDLGFLCATMHYEGSQSVVATDITIPAGEAVGSPTTKYQELYFGTENQPLAARTGVDAGRIFKTADISNDHGVPIEASFKTGISDLGDPDGQKVILEIELLLNNMADVSGGTDIVLDVTVYGGDSNTTLSQLSQHTDVDMSSGQITIHPRVRARYFAIQVDISGPMDATWTTGLGEIEYFGAIVRYKGSGVRQN
jgi:hypothetical protein